jgi:hypothetical protein
LKCSSFPGPYRSSPQNSFRFFVTVFEVRGTPGKVAGVLR